MLKTTAGRAFAAIPKFTSQTSPRLALGTIFFLLIVNKKRGFGGTDQIGLCDDSVGVIINNPIMALSVLLMDRLFDALEFLSRQFWERGFDFLVLTIKPYKGLDTKSTKPIVQEGRKELFRLHLCVLPLFVVEID